MKRTSARRSPRRSGYVLLSALVGVAGVAPAWAQWPQWGGPRRDFKAEATGLADSWPVGGPRLLWKMPSGGGCAGIIVADGRVYVIDHKDEEDRVAALKLDNGERLWSAAMPAPLRDGQRADLGVGSRAAPVVVGQQVITIGFAGRMWCLRTDKTGFAWNRDLVEEYGGKVHELGYSSSPLAYKNTVIALVGGDRYGAVAFNASDGTIAWTSPPLDVSYASPILINVNGQDQIVLMTSTEVIGLDANAGKLLWRRSHVNRSKANWFTPVWGEDNLLFVSSHADGGSRVLRLTQKDGKTTVTDLWHKREIGFHRTNAVRIGDYIYGCAGDESSNSFVAVNVKTGEIAWREPGFPMANCVYADGKLIILDEMGTLSLATVSPAKLTVHSSVPTLVPPVQTAPTLVGNKLLIRDDKTMMVLDIGKTRDDQTSNR